MRNTFYKRYFFLVVLFILSAGVSAGILSDSTKNDSLVTFPKMLVTTTRLEIMPEKLPHKIEVLDSLDLELTIANDITDLLKKNASIDLIQYPGVSAGISIRGFRPSIFGSQQRTLTLLDGRPAGTNNIASLQIYNVERVEVVKGPVSALYGPQAMGGVVNIIPKRSVGPVNTQLKFGMGSFESIETVIHSGGSLFKYLNYDFSGAIYNRGKDYCIGSEYSLSKLNPEMFSGNPQLDINGTAVNVEDMGAGTIRHNTKFDKKDFSLRLGTYLLDDKISIDVRGEMFGADNVEYPGDISKVDIGAGLKNERRRDEQVSVNGKFTKNSFKLLQSWTDAYSENFSDFNYGDTMYMNSRNGTETMCLQAKDDIHLLNDNFFIKPVLTLGVDLNANKIYSQRYKKNGVENAPYSPDSRQRDLGFYNQIFCDMKDGLATMVVGLRQDHITSEILESKFFPNNVARKESFDVFSPSYGLTFSPLKLTTVDQTLTFYHNLGKGFIPQAVATIAGYTVGKPDATGGVQITRGNPALKPEENISVDAGIRAGIKTVGLDISAGFYRNVIENFVEITNLIVSPGTMEKYNDVSYPVASIKTYKNNNNKTTIAGFEWNLEWNILRLFNRPEKLALSTNGHAILVSRAITGTDTSEVFNVRNPNFSIDITYSDVKHLTARLATRFSGRQKDTDWSSTLYNAPDVIYPPFLVTDFSLRVKINEHHYVGGRIANITDENYYEKRGYNLPGRNFGLDYELLF
jgi:outer membrane receptor protein involved in Fe transport